ncbi:MAG: HU family DNA-binding protein [Alphaproteobacteria bacterium]|nr:HU family DNA-binding protein [Alphaproteobacteria bacterium]
MNIMATITRIDLANALKERFGLTSVDSYKMIDIIFDEIEQSLIHGEEVKITGFGTFKILSKSARIGRNPKTGIPAVISARRVTSFHPSAEFRKQVANKK